jgi:GntR family transcriptional regulator, rspAB operon transcriptional repressor
MRGIADAVTMPDVIEPRTVAEGVYRALKRDVITLRHRPGASLTEQELAAAYGSSRVPVREACRRLQQEGLLTAVPYKGYFVNRISLKEINDCFELREVLETHAIHGAVERASEDEIERLEQLAETEYTFHDWASYADFLDQNREFHLEVAALGGNERVVATLRDLLGSMQRFFFLGLDLDDFAAEMRREHQTLVDLLRRRNTKGLVSCIRSQIAASRRRIMAALQDRRLDIPLQ